jgi:hypothetical protein
MSGQRAELSARPITRPDRSHGSAFVGTPKQRLNRNPTKNLAGLLKENIAKTKSLAAKVHWDRNLTLLLAGGRGNESRPNRRTVTARMAATHRPAVRPEYSNVEGFVLRST